MYSRPRNPGFPATIRLLFVGVCAAFSLVAGDPLTVVGSWKADLSKTNPPDGDEVLVAMNIKETALRTYAIRFDTQSRTGGTAAYQTTVQCDGRNRPLPETDSDNRGLTMSCPRGGGLSIRFKQGFATVREQTFSVSNDGNSLNYVATDAGHDRTYVFIRQ